MMPGGMPPITQPPPSRPYRASGSTINSRPQMYNTRGVPGPMNSAINNSGIIIGEPTISTAPPASSHEGPVITVFVGNISERVPEAMIKKILATCGPVVNWKRVSTFGFCEYELVIFKYYCI